MHLKRGLPRTKLIGPTALQVGCDARHCPPPIIAAIQQTVVSRGVQPVLFVGVKKALETIAVQDPRLDVWFEKVGAIVLRSNEELALNQGVQCDGISLCDVQSL